MRKKLLVFIAIFFLLVVLFIMRLYHPTPMNEKEVTTTSSSSSVVAPSDAWQKYTADTFELMLPSLPQRVSEKMPVTNSKDVIQYDMYLVQQPIGSTFMLSVIHYPESFDTSDTGQLFESITNEMLANNKESQLLSSQSGMFLKLPSIENVIQNGNLHVFMKAVLLNKTLYVLTVVDAQKDRGKEHFEKVLQSFRFVR